MDCGINYELNRHGREFNLMLHAHEKLRMMYGPRDIYSYVQTLSTQVISEKEVCHFINDLYNYIIIITLEQNND